SIPSCGGRKTGRRKYVQVLPDDHRADSFGLTALRRPRTGYQGNCHSPAPTGPLPTFRIDVCNLSSCVISRFLSLTNLSRCPTTPRRYPKRYSGIEQGIKDGHEPPFPPDRIDDRYDDDQHHCSGCCQRGRQSYWNAAPYRPRLFRIENLFQPTTS